MSLIITFMLEPAKLQMNCANASGSSARRNVLRDRPAGSVPAIAFPLQDPEPAESGRRSTVQQAKPLTSHAARFAQGQQE